MFRQDGGTLLTQGGDTGGDMFPTTLVHFVRKLGDAFFQNLEILFASTSTQSRRFPIAFQTLLPTIVVAVAVAAATRVIQLGADRNRRLNGGGTGHTIVARQFGGRGSSSTNRWFGTGTSSTTIRHEILFTARGGTR